MKKSELLIGPEEIYKMRNLPYGALATYMHGYSSLWHENPHPPHDDLHRWWVEGHMRACLETLEDIERDVIN